MECHKGFDYCSYGKMAQILFLGTTLEPAISKSWKAKLRVKGTNRQTWNLPFSRLLPWRIACDVTTEGDYNRVSPQKLRILYKHRVTFSLSPLKFNIDTKIGDLERVNSFQLWRHFGYLC